jgi:hypothetical protein
LGEWRDAARPATLPITICWSLSSARRDPGKVHPVARMPITYRQARPYGHVGLCARLHPLLA